MKQKIEIEVDVPDGFELAGFRKPQAGEYGLDILDGSIIGVIEYVVCSSKQVGDVVILRRKPEYKWPDFIKSGMYLCMNSQGTWRLSEHEPTLSLYGWVSGTGNMIQTSNFIMSTPDTPSDWTKSLIRKP